MGKKDHFKALFESIDRQDLDTFLDHLSGDVIFRFGNAEPVSGKAAVGDVVHGFFSSIKALRHEITESWDMANSVTCHGMVTYTRHDSSTLTIPFANIFRVDGGLISEYLIFADVSGLY